MAARSKRASDAERAERADLVARLLDAGRAQSTAAVMFHAAVAAQLGLSVTEEKALDLLQRHGPLTAGELAAHAGLAPASVTGLVDRLAAKGVARRIADPDDRRRVRVELDPALPGRMRPMFVPFVDGLRAICAGYRSDELEAIVRFLDEVRALQHEATARLTGPAPRKRRARRG